MDAKEFFESALSDWEASCLRNPNMARFGNSNAKGKGKVETMTEIPPSEEEGSEWAPVTAVRHTVVAMQHIR